MRYLMPLLAAVCLVGLVPDAARGQGFTMGIKGGLNVSNLNVDDAADPDFGFDSRTGFVGGAYLQCGGVGWFTLQGELQFSRSGAKSKGADPAYEIDLDYLRVPVLFMARFSSGESPLLPIAYLGPQVSFQTQCQITADGNGASASFDCASEELGEPLITNLVEFGLVFGGGLEVPVSRLTMQLDARYNLGLSNINGGPDADDISVKNRGWSFMVGLGYPFG
jgi:hypothetical protein